MTVQKTIVKVISMSMDWQEIPLPKFQIYIIKKNSHIISTLAVLYVKGSGKIFVIQPSQQTDSESK